MKPSLTPFISPCENGQSVSTSMRPARDSDNFGRSITFAEPVSKNLPGFPFPVNGRFDGGKEFGHMLHFIQGDGRVQTGNEAVGIAFGRRQNAGIIKRQILPAGFLSSADCTKVLLPVCRAPLTRTAGVSPKAWRRCSVMWRRIMLYNQPQHG